MAQNEAAVRCNCWSGSFTEHTAECASRAANRPLRPAPDPLRELAELVDGATVSVDVSTGDHDIGARVFGRVYSVQREGDGTLTLLAEQGERNEPDALRELAEWLLSLDGTTVAVELPAVAQIIARAREALGRTEEGDRG